MTPHPGGGEGLTTPEAGVNPVVRYVLARFADDTVDRDPSRFARQLAEEFETGVAKLRRERGTVHLPEDTHETIRRVHAIAQAAAEWEGAFKGLRERAYGVLGEELVEAVGHRKDNPDAPARPMNVPVPDGLIQLAPSYTSKANVDMDQVLYGLAESEALTWAGSDNPLADADDDVRAAAVQYAVAVASRAFAEVVRSTTPKTTGIEALATMLGAYGEDKLASIVRGAVGSPAREFRGVTVKYQDKPNKAA